MAKPKPTFHILHRSGYTLGTTESQGETNMNANEIDVLLPPNVAEEGEIEASQTLQEWEDFPGLEPAGITAMRASQGSREKSDGGAEGLYPPGVE
jgi:hypothetical protein